LTKSKRFVNDITGWQFVTMQGEMSTLLGREVDLCTSGFLSDYFREDVLRKAKVIYERV
jgi:predicted nucleotidyltransferase